MARQKNEFLTEARFVRGGSHKGLFASIGAVGAALLGSLCCVGPLLFVTFGVGAGLASTFEPLRPVFGVLMLGGLARGFYTVYGRKPKADKAATDPDCAAGSACAVPRNRRRDRVILWSATVLALILWSFPTWSTLFV